MKILDNPVYIGKIAYGKNVTEKVKGTREDRKSTRLNSSHGDESRMPSSA